MDLTTGPSLLLGMLPEKPGVAEVLAYQLNGLIVVFLALTFIWGIMEIVGIYFKRKAAAEAAIAAANAAVAAKHAAAEAEARAKAEAEKPSIPPEVIVAIAAAIKVTLREKRYKIHAIVPNASDWAREGRRQIFASHAIR